MPDEPLNTDLPRESSEPAESPSPAADLRPQDATTESESSEGDPEEIGFTPEDVPGEIFGEAPLPPKDPSPTDTPEDPPEPALTPSDETSKLPKDFRKRLEVVNSELATARKREQELSQQLEDARKTQGGDVETITKQLAAKEAELARLNGELQAEKFQKSPEYVEKYEKAYDFAARSARRLVENLSVRQEDPSTGEETTRKASWDDFVKLYQNADGKADQNVIDMFGASAYRVQALLTDFQRRDGEMEIAMEEEKEKWQERQTSASAQRIRQGQELNQLWDRVNTDIKTKKPDWYSDRDGDKEGNELLKKGYETFDAYFRDRSKMKPEDVVVYEAHLRHRAAALPRMAREKTLLQEQVKQLEGKIRKLQGSGPGGDLRGDSSADPTGTDFEDVPEDIWT